MVGADTLHTPGIAQTGFSFDDAVRYVLSNSPTAGQYSLNGRKNGFALGAMTGLAAGQVIGFKLDCDNFTLEILNNNVSQITIAGLDAGTWDPAIGDGVTSGPGLGATANFGAGSFTYSVPTGYNAGIDS